MVSGNIFIYQVLWYHSPPKATLQWMKSNIFWSKTVWKSNSVISVIVNQMKQSIRGEFCYIKKDEELRLGERKKAMRKIFLLKAQACTQSDTGDISYVLWEKNVQSDYCLLSASINLMNILQS